MPEDAPSTATPAPGTPAQDEVLRPADRPRPGYLTLYIALAVVFNLWAAVQEFNAAGAPRVGTFYFIAGVLSLIAAGSAIGIYLWSRKSVYVYGACFVLFMVLNLIGGNFGLAARGVIPFVVMVFVVRPVWKYMY